MVAPAPGKILCTRLHINQTPVEESGFIFGQADVTAACPPLMVHMYKDPPTICWWCGFFRTNMHSKHLRKGSVYEKSSRVM